jgi:acylphosphatase
MNQHYLHCLISGKVQGVFFRANTQKKAKALQINGWVKNLASGHVEVYGSGAPQAIAEFREWLKHGPKKANVTTLQDLVSPYEEFKDFSIR